MTVPPKDNAVAPGSRTIHLADIEAQYRNSPYVKEICVMVRRERATPAVEQLFAVVVPDRELLRRRRIVNAGDLLRFEMEGQSIHLPADCRVRTYEIWFEPLPRTAAGDLRRDEVAQRVRDKERHRERLRSAVDHGDPSWTETSHASVAIALISRRAGGHPITRDANLEIDLGLDSMDRVELITDLERHFRVRIPEEDVATIFTVGELVEAIRPSEPTVAQTEAEDAWTVLLRQLPSPMDPPVSGLVQARPIAARFFFLLPRLFRVLAPRIEIRGLEHLPRHGPYIITPNHQSYLDPFVVCGALPFAIFRQVFFVGASEYFESRLMQWVAMKGNCVPVDPDANLISAMRAAAFGLTHGKILMLFPEGERSIDGTVKRFKKGAAILSRQLDVPMVPVAIDGSFELWPRNRPLNCRLLLPWSGHRIRVTVGEPVRPGASLGYADAAGELRRIVERLWSAP